MKRLPAMISPVAAPPKARRAYTLTEVLIATALCALVMVGVVYTHVFGLRMATLTNSKLSATHEARAALSRVRDEIRAGKLLFVGNSDGAAFTPIAPDRPQTGNALQIYPTLNTNQFVCYYLDAAEQTLKRKPSGGGPTEEIARYITNQMVFRAEDHLGNLLTADRNHRVIRMTLEFCQWEYPLARVGEGNYYQSYRLQTRVTRRAIE